MGLVALHYTDSAGAVLANVLTKKILDYEKHISFRPGKKPYRSPPEASRSHAERILGIGSETTAPGQEAADRPRIGRK